MINDINVNGVNLRKYVDDTSMAETVHKGQPSGIQIAVDELVWQAETDKFQLNETKCKELQISFSRSADSFEAVTINNKPIEVVTSVKLLGLTISNNLEWNAHIENVIKKRSSRLYQLRQLNFILLTSLCSCLIISSGLSLQALLTMVIVISIFITFKTERKKEKSVQTFK